MSTLRDSAVTVVGGGAVGAAALYFLAEAGYRDLQLIEAGDTASETTSQAAGLVGQVRSTVEQTWASMRSAELFRSMDDSFGAGADWRETGSLRLALGPSAEQEVRGLAAVAAKAGLEVELVDARRAQELCPVLDDVDQVRVGLWCPTDGFVQPNSVAAAYLNAARRLGARVTTHTRALRVSLDDRGRVDGLVTDRGGIRTETVVNAAGPWAGALARTAGVDLPVVPVLVQYFVTDPQPGWHSGLPCLRIPEIQVYARGEGDGMLVGGFENSGTSIDPREVEVGSPLPHTEDWDVLAEFSASFETLVPQVSEAGVRAVFTGWPGFTPDGRFLIGPVSSVPGLVMAAGCNAHGVQGSDVIGRHLVESLAADPSPLVSSFSPDRFVPRDWDWQSAQASAQGVCENYYPRKSPLDP